MNTRNQLIQALDLDRCGDWDGAHRIVQTIENEASYRIHAYLHRKEGDPGNARYWYSRAGRPVPDASLAEEWSLLRSALDVM